MLSSYFSGLLCMDEQRQDDQQEPIFNSSVPIQDITLAPETGGKRGSWISVWARQPDDDIQI